MNTATNANSNTLTIYYDGSCELCSAEMRNVKSRDADNRITLVDCSDAHFDATGLPFSAAQMMNVITARDANGEWLTGVDVFVAMYGAIEMSFVSNTLANPLVKPLADRAYPWVVKNRYALSTLGVQHVMNWFAARAEEKKERADSATTRTQS
jgi:predicted DCC family thiol-disulfide oxidoreductase YuxK